MIKYALHCERAHEFEVWFKNSADYDKQRKRGLVSCPACGSDKIVKSLMAPSLGRGTKKGGVAAVPEAVPETVPAAPDTSPEIKSPVAMMSPQESEFRAKLKELRDHLTKNAENVGGKFPDEARKMHYGEIEHRSIYGEATAEDAKEMLEEGIEFHPLPVLPDERN
ncbi:MAG: DUF1178 family protein [Alphaproteobacteria bacterium]|nr:DUF1178 family protein [Alphaproteobacteria bacterium]